MRNVLLPILFCCIACGSASPRVTPPAPIPTAKQPKEETHQGTLPLRQIHTVVRQHQPSARYCYKKELHKDRTLAGRVTIAFVVEESGAVSDAKIRRSSLNSKAVESCLVEATLRMIFPKPKGGSVEVSYPYLFEVTNPPTPTPPQKPTNLGAVGGAVPRGMEQHLRRRLHVRVGTPVILGSLSQSSAESVISKRQSLLEGCYARPPSQHTRYGRVTVELVVEKNGRPQDTGELAYRVESITMDSSTLSNPPLEECVLQVMKHMRFPVGNSTMTIPIYSSN